MSTVIVSPAYGRDYSTQAEVKAAWQAGEDFKAEPDSIYCSRRNFRPGTIVQFRYARLQKTCTITVR